MYDYFVKYSHMAVEGEACRQRLSTDCVLQLLLHGKSKSESDSDGVSDYRAFIGKVLTDSEDEELNEEDSWIIAGDVNGSDEDKIDQTPVNWPDVLD